MLEWMTLCERILGLVSQRGWLHGFTKGRIQLNWTCSEKLVQHMWKLCVHWGDANISWHIDVHYVEVFFCTHAKFPPLQSNVHVMWDEMKCNIIWCLLVLVFVVLYCFVVFTTLVWWSWPVSNNGDRPHYNQIHSTKSQVQLFRSCCMFIPQID